MGVPLRTSARLITTWLLGCYCRQKAVAIEHEKPAVLINRLLDFEEEIKTDLQDLLTLVTVPTSVEGLRVRCDLNRPRRSRQRMPTATERIQEVTQRSGDRKA